MNGREKERERVREGKKREVWRRERKIPLCGFDCWLLHVKQTMK